MPFTEQVNPQLQRIRLDLRAGFLADIDLLEGDSYKISFKFDPINFDSDYNFSIYRKEKNLFTLDYSLGSGILPLIGAEVEIGNYLYYIYRLDSGNEISGTLTLEGDHQPEVGDLVVQTEVQDIDGVPTEVIVWQATIDNSKIGYVSNYNVANAGVVIDAEKITINIQNNDVPIGYYSYLFKSVSRAESVALRVFGNFTIYDDIIYD